jgi:DNA polymerase-3 subunit epsilon
MANEFSNQNDLAYQLEKSGDYKVLRRLTPRRVVTEPDGTPTKLGIFLDLETTGLNSSTDEIIEIAMVPFTYSVDGRIFEIREAFQALRQPSSPITSEITKLTGLTNEMLAGKSVDPADVAAFAAPAALIIAHNARFDRPFSENFCDVFTTKPWACSMSQVPWKDEGFDGTRLSYLLVGFGLFYDAHRATNDCLAGIEVLSRRLPKSDELALARLLTEARKATCRVWAENSPFDFKDILKARGYRWNSGDNGKPKSWYADIGEDNLDAELTFLRTEIYQRDVDPFVQKIDAYDRFSERV